MAPYLVIEVLGGPLDGLRACGEKDKVSIGRQVGNSLTLAIDQAVSGYHAEIVLEGKVWCLRDLGSTNGTWFQGKRIDPTTSVPLESESQILVGTNTVLRVFLADKAVAPVRFNAHQVDLRTVVAMEPDLSGCLAALYNDGPAFLDCGIVFKRFAQDSGLGLLAGFFQHKELLDPIESWIEQKRSANRAYRLDPDFVTIAPRVLQFFSKPPEAEEPLTLRGCIEAILSERLVCGKNNVVLEGWLENYKPQDVAPDIAKEEEPVRSNQPKPVAVSAPEVTPEPEPLPEPKSEPQDVPSAPAGVVEHDPQKELFLDFILQTEKIVLGFIKDAVHPTTVPDHFALPGFGCTAEEVLDKDDDEKTDQFFKDYLPVLISSLKVVLVAQREGAGNYPAKLDEQLTDILEEINKGSMFDQFRQSSSLPPADRIRGVLKTAETSGLGEHLIRERIREKMKIIRLTREENT